MKYAYGIVGIVGAIASIVVGILGMIDVMVVAALLSALLVLAANADRIAKLKATATGIEAETRAVIDEARATIHQLRAVGRIAVQANLSLAMRAGRWGGFSFDEKEAVRIASVEALKQLAVPAKDQEEMFREWHTVTRFDYAHLALGRSTIPPQIRDNLALQEEWKILGGGGFEGIPSPHAVESFLRKAGMLDDEAAQLLEDYRYYEKNRAHRRPDVFKQLVERDR